MEVKPLIEPLAIDHKLQKRSMYTKKASNLVSKSGCHFRSIDNFLVESIYQTYFPKENNEDLDLLVNPDDLEEDLKKEMDLQPINVEEKTCYQRCFGPMNPGSLRGSIFTLMACALGAGSLALSHAVFMKCGLINGIALLSITVLISLYSLNLLMYSSTKVDCHSYSELVSHCFSTKITNLIEIIFIIYVFGVVCTYQILISNFFITLLKDFGLDPEIANQEYVRDIQIVILTLLISPVALKKSFYSFRHITILGVSSIFYTTLVVLFGTPNNMLKNWNSSNFNLAIFDWNIFTGFATSLFSFTCMTIVLPLKKELINPVEYRINKIFNRSALIEYIVYMVIGISGYFSFLNETPEIIIDKTNSNEINYPILISKISLIVNLIISIPININPGRIHFQFLIKRYNIEINEKIHIIITYLFLIGSCLVGIFFPHILTAFSFLGGLCCVIIGILIPGLMWIILNGKGICFYNISILIYSIFFSIIGFIGAIISLLNAMKIIKL